MVKQAMTRSAPSACSTCRTTAASRGVTARCHCWSAASSIELDLVMFREREPRAARGGLRRLVMTLDTTHFGRVRVEARAVDNRLIVKLGATTAGAVDALASHGRDVRAALEQLGWAVDEVRYEIGAPNAGAAHAVVQHVLSAGTVDQEL